MDSNVEGNLLEIMDLARTLRQEQLFIQQEQATFSQLTETLAANSTSITKLAYICAQQRQNLNDLVISRPETGPMICCRRANNYENFKFIDARKVLDYEHAITFEELFNHLYRSPYLLALSLATGDRLSEITQHHMSSVIHTVSTGIFGNAVNTKDVEMLLKLLRELIEIQIAVSDNPRRLLRANSSAFARLYHRLNESMFSAKIFLTAALFDPIMIVLSDTELMLDVDPNNILNNLSKKERLKRFGAENSLEYQQNIEKFRNETFVKLHRTSMIFIDSLIRNWSLFPSTLRWLVQTMSHQLKQVHFSDKIINEIITDMVFTHFICPAIVSPDIQGIIDQVAPISEQVRFNLMQIGQIIQMLALAKNDVDVDAKYSEIYAKFETNMITNLIDLLLVSQSGEDVVAILSQQNDFERSHLLSTQNELQYFVQFYRILMESDEFDVVEEERQKLKKLLAHLPEEGSTAESAAAAQTTNGTDPNGSELHGGKERSNKSLISLATKATKTKIAKSIPFTTNGVHHNSADESHSASRMVNGNGLSSGLSNGTSGSQADGCANSASSSPLKSLPYRGDNESQAVLVFNLYNSDDNKLQPLTEEEVLKMNSIGQEISNGEALLVDDAAESAILENTIDKSSVANGFDGIDDGLSDVLRPMHSKTTRFSLSHDDASIGNSDNLEAVSEAPSNHSVTSSLELEENDENDNLSDMVSANVSGRGSPNISGRDTPSSQVTDGGSIHNALPTPQMQKLISKVRSDIEDKFCKFELKKFEGDETVSIISDTWSTDVLASDSETLDASERGERDRHFSTPLIPSAVVLPGDNNFDVLRGGPVRSLYLDATDQRSESNWSTDVLASDSEKLAEVDTDDNVSVTAKSDITDSGARSEQERDQLAAAISAPIHSRQQRSMPESAYNDRRRLANTNDNNENTNNNNNNNRANRNDDDDDDDDDDANDGRAVDGSASDRSQEDSAFYDAVNMCDEAAAAAAAAVGAGFNGELATVESYHAMSSLARSSVRTTNQLTGENTFQQEYKSSYNDNDNKEPFLAAPCMRRQTSAESSISNQSLNMDDVAATPTSTSTAASKCKQQKSHHHHHKGAIKKKKHATTDAAAINHSLKRNESNDLIDFSDFGIEKSSINNNSKKPIPRNSPINVNGIDELRDLFGGIGSDISVEHRRISHEQRTVVFDGRRNGMALKNNGGGENNLAPPSLRRHQSLNYENHEIMIDSTISQLKRSSAMPSLAASSAQTDDDKRKERELQEELLLCLKAEGLKLTEGDEVVAAATTSGNNPVTINNAAAAVSTSSPKTTTTVTMISSSSRTTSKSTGAIPKSISFDASADKVSSSSGGVALTPHRTVSSHRSSRLPNGLNVANSGIFNKLKQGIFKHRRNNKTTTHHPTGGNATGGNIQGEEFSPSSRSVSFSTNASEISLDLLGGPGGSGSGRSIPLAGYCDINEDILAKYRRKVSTSSEATTSESIGSGGAMAGGNSKAKPGESDRNSLPNDKVAAFTTVKKKIRTVLSKTDLHTNDFRHTTYSSASPLLTYLQIQLAQALNLQNFQQISYVSEAIRCISTLEAAQHAQLLEELQNDIQKRQHYLQYLMRYRQNLLLMMENVEQYESRLRNESTNCNRYLIALCMRLFLEKRQSNIEAFQEEFSRLTVSDDKIDLIEEFIDGLMEESLANGGFLHSMPEWLVQEARVALERILLQRMYQQVMFPNEDADLSRDSVLSEHIRKLQQNIRPSHSALRIRQEFLAEAPWTFAQQQLSFISAYKTPREKLLCVIRCISSIMSLLHMSSGRIPAADDLLPVLIYVVIMANPPYLLSTVEYITCFIGEKLDGEEQFHWTLFCSVVKYIKTMDYSD